MDIYENNGLLASPSSLVLGVDPGSLHTGYGLIERRGSEINLVVSGRISPKAQWLTDQRLAYIHRGLIDVVQKFRPTALALEDVFTFKNPRSALKLAQARGVAILAAALENVPVFEYAPNRVKSSLTGNGHADKSQVSFMVKQVLRLTQNLPYDTSDSLAVALCHLNDPQVSLSSTSAKRVQTKNWRALSVEDLTAMGFNLEKIL
ncbi:MAG: crossover junction endodeoxyribonuclease RuvC [Deltaproteobacteria bacterium]|jgi:crossover junction endodeoxyribonuclease RuvC|nr:crossover junction endodeoxyribonuclease RuvC [Deltaproteobacteria bacterium]